MNTEEIILKVKDITEDYNSILSIEKAIELGLHGGPHNGSGPRTKLSKIFINITFYGNNANPNIYPKCYEETIDIDKDLIDKYKKERIAKGLPQGNRVIGFIIVGENNNESKNRKIRDTGAELIDAGKTFEEASQIVENIISERNLYYVHPANEPHLINGVGTEFLEVIEQLPDVDAVVIPIGAGSEAAAAVTVLKSINPNIEIYAVQAECSPAAYLSWKSGVITSADNTTFAGGFATGVGYEIPFEIYKNNLEDFILLSENEIYQGIALAGYYTQNLVEGAGASTIAAAIKLKDRLKDKKVVLQFSGCNASAREIERAYNLSDFKVGYIQ